MSLGRPPWNEGRVPRQLMLCGLTALLASTCPALGGHDGGATDSAGGVAPVVPQHGVSAWQYSAAARHPLSRAGGLPLGRLRGGMGRKATEPDLSGILSHLRKLENRGEKSQREQPEVKGGGAGKDKRAIELLAEDRDLMRVVADIGPKWTEVSIRLGARRSAASCKARYKRLQSSLHLSPPPASSPVVATAPDCSDADRLEDRMGKARKKEKRGRETAADGSGKDGPDGTDDGWGGAGGASKRARGEAMASSVTSTEGRAKKRTGPDVGPATMPADLAALDPIPSSVGAMGDAHGRSRDEGRSKKEEIELPLELPSGHVCNEGKFVWSPAHGWTLRGASTRELLSRYMDISQPKNKRLRAYFRPLHQLPCPHPLTLGNASASVASVSELYGEVPAPVQQRPDLRLYPLHDPEAVSRLYADQDTWTPDQQDGETENSAEGDDVAGASAVAGCARNETVWAATRQGDGQVPGNGDSRAFVDQHGYVWTPSFTVQHAHVAWARPVLKCSGRVSEYGKGSKACKGRDGEPSRSGSCNGCGRLAAACPINLGAQAEGVGAGVGSAQDDSSEEPESGGMKLEGAAERLVGDSWRRRSHWDALPPGWRQLTTLRARRLALQDSALKFLDSGAGFVKEAREDSLETLRMKWRANHRPWKAGPWEHQLHEGALAAGSQETPLKSKNFQPLRRIEMWDVGMFESEWSMNMTQDMEQRWKPPPPPQWAVRLLEEKRARNADGAPNDFVRLLRACCKTNFSEIVRCRSMVGWRDMRGWTALHYASLFAQPVAVKALLKAGAHPSSENTLGVTPGEMLQLWRKARPQTYKRIRKLLRHTVPCASLDPRESSLDRWTGLILRGDAGNGNSTLPALNKTMMAWTSARGARTYSSANVIPTHYIPRQFGVDGLQKAAFDPFGSADGMGSYKWESGRNPFEITKPGIFGGFRRQVPETE